MTNEQRLRSLKSRGVEFSHPASTHIADDVDLDRIEPGVRIHGGCRIAGKRTFIGKGTIIGREGPAAIEDCAIGCEVELKGGSFRASVFLDGSSLGPGGQVREACLLEEEASAAHAVGLKQTILFPFVTLGSLINFCDCLMAGGTSLRDHGEVGSSYVHFNFTPNQDKATPSLIGDVPRGVMLDQRPAFLGGQGGLVGPARVGFGSVVAAGIVCRADVGENVLVAGIKQEAKGSPYRPGVYFQIGRKVRNNLGYIANLVALRAWYAEVRSRFLQPVLLQEAVTVMNAGLVERIFRLKELAEKMPGSAAGLKDIKIAGIDRVIKQENEFHAAWPELEEYLSGLAEGDGQAGLPVVKAKAAVAAASKPESPTLWNGNQPRRAEGKAGMRSIERLRDDFLNPLGMMAGNDYVRRIQTLDADTKLKGTRWLSAIVASVEDAALSLLPSF